MEEGDGETASDLVAMSRLAGIWAIPGGVFLALFTLVMLSGKGVTPTELSVTAAIAGAFLISGFLGAFGLYPEFVAGVWTLSLAGFVAWVFASDAGMGLFEGGLVIFFIFFYLLVGAIFSTIGWIRSRRNEAA